MDTNDYDQPTMPWHDDEKTQVWQQAPVEETGPVEPATAKVIPGSRRSALSRRRLLLGGLAGAGVAVVGGGVALAEWEQHQQQAAVLQSSGSKSAQMGHLLRRAGFGANTADLTTYNALDYNTAVERLLNYTQVSDDTMEQRLSALHLDMNVVADQQRWWLLRMAWTQRPLLEKMTLFWHGVLTSSYSKVGGKGTYARMTVQNNFLRSHAFDTLDNILLGITGDPAMLLWLDLTKSHKNSPNENYARELMELFTLGLGNYTQQDVSEAAAALTGWHVVGKSTTSTYNPKDHNIQEKVFLGKKGNFDYKDVISILANHPATPWFIARKLFTFFVYENPSNADLQPLVESYTKNNHNMGEVMRTLLLSPQFSSSKAYRSRVKSPTEFVAGAYRALEFTGNGGEMPGNNSLIGQILFDPPNVAGWPGDKVSALWLNSGTWMARLNYVNALLNATRDSNGKYKATDFQALVDSNHIDSPEHFVDHFSSILLDGSMTAERKAALLSYFTATNTGGQKIRKKITLTNGQSYPLNNVRGTVYLMMSSPEYQLS